MLHDRTKHGRILYGSVLLFYWHYEEGKERVKPFPPLLLAMFVLLGPREALAKRE